MPHKKERIGVVGLGYVGLPLACAFARYRPVIGYDVSHTRINDLCRGRDPSNEVLSEELQQKNLRFTSSPKDLRRCTAMIVAVPTPVDEAKIPDLTALRLATATVGENLQKGTLVVFESTVYPGVTEEIFLPIL